MTSQRSKVVNLPEHPQHDLRRRTTAPSSTDLESTTFVSSFPQAGHRTYKKVPGPPLRAVAHYRLAEERHVRRLTDRAQSAPRTRPLLSEPPWRHPPETMAAGITMRCPTSIAFEPPLASTRRSTTGRGSAPGASSTASDQ